MDYDQRKALSQGQAIPILDQLEEWIEQSLYQTIPSSPIGDAIRYYQAWKSYL